MDWRDCAFTLRDWISNLGQPGIGGGDAGDDKVAAALIRKLKPLYRLSLHELEKDYYRSDDREKRHETETEIEVQDDNTEEESVEEVEQLLHFFYSKYQSLLMPNPPIPGNAQSRRAAITTADLSLLTALDLPLLKSVYMHLREKEENDCFQRHRMEAVVEATTFYSKETFSYGSTSFVSIYNLLHSSPLYEHVVAPLASRNDEVGASQREVSSLQKIKKRSRLVVFGSSTGWICFYLALYLSSHHFPSSSLLVNQVDIHGYEVLHPLVQVANDVRDTYKIQNVHFTCGDMLHATEIDQISLLVLTVRVIEELSLRSSYKYSI